MIESISLKWLIQYCHDLKKILTKCKGGKKQIHTIHMVMLLYLSPLSVLYIDLLLNGEVSPPIPDYRGATFTPFLPLLPLT